MIARPSFFMCLSAALVVTSVPRMLMTRSNSSNVLSSKVFGIAMPALFAKMSSPPRLATRFRDARSASLRGGAVPTMVAFS